RTRRLSSKSGPAGQRAVHRHNLGTIMFGRPANIDELAVHVQQNNVNRARLRTRLMPQPDFLLSASRQVEAPLTGIWGARDAFSPFPADRIRAIRIIRPDIRSTIFPDAGHWVQYEQAAECNTTMLQFLSKFS